MYLLFKECQIVFNSGYACVVVHIEFSGIVICCHDKILSCKNLLISRKFNELAPVLTKWGVSLKLKGKIYDACVQRVLVYGS